MAALGEASGLKHSSMRGRHTVLAHAMVDRGAEKVLPLTSATVMRLWVPTAYGVLLIEWTNLSKLGVL